MNDAVAAIGQTVILSLAAVSIIVFGYLGIRQFYRRLASLIGSIERPELLRFAVLMAVCLLLLFALDRQPYAYYHLLRIAVFAACVAIVLEQQGVTYWTVAFGVTGLLYNPVLPPRFDREFWEAVNIGTMLMFIAYWWFSRELRKQVPPRG